MYIYCTFKNTCLIQVEELFLEFARKSSRFLTDLKNIEEDLIDSVKCNTLEEIQVCSAIVLTRMMTACLL